MRLKRVLWSAANLLGGVVLVLLVMDPSRPLLHILVLLAVSVVLMLLPAFLPHDK
jgi:hypothetical protein